MRTTTTATTKKVGINRRRAYQKSCTGALTMCKEQHTTQKQCPVLNGDGLERVALMNTFLPPLPPPSHVAPLAINLLAEHTAY